MCMRRDFDLNSIDMYTDSSSSVYTDSLKQVFRKTMVSQEIAFQNQVHELHRIYGTQRTMMQNNTWIELDRVGGSTTHSKSQELLQEKFQGGVFYKVQQRPFDRVDQSDNLKLSLSIGDGKNRKRSGSRTWFDVNLACDVIDLEDSAETLSNDDLGNEHSSLCTALPVESVSKHDSQKSVVTDLILDDHERTSFNQDIERFDLNVLSEDLPSKKERTNSYIVMDLDLNKAYCHDSSSQSSDLIEITHPSRSSSSHEDGDSQLKFWSKESNNFSDEASGIGHQDNAQNCSPVSSKGENETAEIVGLGLKENTSIVCALEKEFLKSQTHMRHNSKESNCEDVVISNSTVVEEQSDVSLSSLKTCHVGDNEVELGNHVLADKSSDSSDFDKFDASIREAAESLIHIGFESTDCFRDCYGGNNNETVEETPEVSSDSYELFTLGLKECTEDELCVLSMPCEVDVAAENKNYGLKIRRGRRLKDFQRDILPGLASLSRHEIREDINILEGVLRSREYRKMQAKMADEGQGWCVPTRSRRSRLNCSKRRRVSS